MSNISKRSLIPKSLRRCSAPYISLISLPSFALRVSTYCCRSNRYSKILPRHRSKYTLMPEMTSSNISASADPGRFGRAAFSAALYALRIPTTLGFRGSGTSCYFSCSEIEPINLLMFRYILPVVHKNTL